MEVTIKGSAQEIAALVIAVQERRRAEEMKISEEEFLSYTTKCTRFQQNVRR